MNQQNINPNQQIFIDPKNQPQIGQGYQNQAQIVQPNGNPQLIPPFLNVQQGIQNNGFQQNNVNMGQQLNPQINWNINNQAQEYLQTNPHLNQGNFNNNPKQYPQTFPATQQNKCLIQANQLQEKGQQNDNSQQQRNFNQQDNQNQQQNSQNNNLIPLQQNNQYPSFPFQIPQQQQQGLNQITSQPNQQQQLTNNKLPYNITNNSNPQNQKPVNFNGGNQLTNLNQQQIQQNFKQNLQQYPPFQQQFIQPINQQLGNAGQNEILNNNLQNQQQESNNTFVQNQYKQSQQQLQVGQKQQENNENLTMRVYSNHNNQNQTPENLNPFNITQNQMVNLQKPPQQINQQNQQQFQQQQQLQFQQSIGQQSFQKQQNNSENIASQKNLKIEQQQQQDKLVVQNPNNDQINTNKEQKNIIFNQFNTNQNSNNQAPPLNLNQNQNQISQPYILQQDLQQGNKISLNQNHEQNNQQQKPQFNAQNQFNITSNPTQGQNSQNQPQVNTFQSNGNANINLYHQNNMNQQQQANQQQQLQQQLNIQQNQTINQKINNQINQGQLIQNQMNNPINFIQNNQQLINQKQIQQGVYQNNAFPISNQLQYNQIPFNNQFQQQNFQSTNNPVSTNNNMQNQPNFPIQQQKQNQNEQVYHQQQQQIQNIQRYQGVLNNQNNEQQLQQQLQQQQQQLNQQQQNSQQQQKQQMRNQNEQDNPQQQQQMQNFQNQQDIQNNQNNEIQLHQEIQQQQQQLNQQQKNSQQQQQQLDNQLLNQMNDQEILQKDQNDQQSQNQSQIINDQTQLQQQTDINLDLNRLISFNQLKCTVSSILEIFNNQQDIIIIMEECDYYMKQKLNKNQLANAKNLLDFNVKSLSSFSSLKSYANQNINSQQLQSAYYKVNEDFPIQIVIRGDGNCFYRSIIFGYLIKLLVENNSKSFLNILRLVNQINNLSYQIERINENKMELTQEFKYHFLYFWIEKFIQYQQEKKFTLYSLYEAYNKEPFVDTSCVVICRNIILNKFNYLCNDPDYCFFITDENKKKCPQYLLQYGQEAEDVIIPIAAKAFQVDLIVQNLYRQQNDIITDKYDYKNDDSVLSSVLSVLFTKGHYNCLFDKKFYEDYKAHFQIDGDQFEEIQQNNIQKDQQEEEKRQQENQQREDISQYQMPIHSNLHQDQLKSILLEEENIILQEQLREFVCSYCFRLNKGLVIKFVGYQLCLECLDTELKSKSKKYDKSINKFIDSLKKKRKCDQCNQANQTPALFTQFSFKTSIFFVEVTKHCCVKCLDKVTLKYKYPKYRIVQFFNEINNPCFNCKVEKNPLNMIIYFKNGKYKLYIVICKKCYQNEYSNFFNGINKVQKHYKDFYNKCSKCKYLDQSFDYKGKLYCTKCLNQNYQQIKSDKEKEELVNQVFKDIYIKKLCIICLSQKNKHDIEVSVLVGQESQQCQVCSRCMKQIIQLKPNIDTYNIKSKYLDKSIQIIISSQELQIYFNTQTQTYK